MKFRKLTALPQVLEMNTLYFIAEVESPTFSLYITEVDSVNLKTLAKDVALSDIDGISDFCQGILSSTDQIAFRSAIGSAPIANPEFTGIVKAPTSLIKSSYTPIDATTSTNINISDGSYFTRVITADTTFSINAYTSGAEGAASLILELTNAGNFVTSFSNTVHWNNGTPPIYTSDGKDLLSFISKGNTGVLIGLVLAQGLPA